MQKQTQKFHRAKKSLGQNFLKSELALRKIIEAGEIKPDDLILEIGPGKGALTEKLLLARHSEGVGGEGTGCVIAVEKDKNLVEFLKEKFAKEIQNEKLFLIEEDILKFEVKKVLQDVLEKSLGSRDGDGQRKFSAENFCAFKKIYRVNFVWKLKNYQKINSQKHY